MAAASADLGGLFAEGQGHEIAQGYGSFLWAGILLYRDGWLAGLGSSSGIELARIARRTRIADPTLSFHVRGRFSANCRVVIRKSSNFPDVTWPIVTIEGEESIEADLGVLFRITVWH